MNLRRRYINTLQVAPVIIALIILGVVGGGLFALNRTGYQITPAQVYAAENAYGVALTAADGYINSCRALGTPPTCKAVALTIQADVTATNAAYQKVKGVETNPPVGAAAQFLSALGILQSVIPGSAA